MQIAISGFVASVPGGVGAAPLAATADSSAMLASRFVETLPVERVATSSRSAGAAAATGFSGTIAQKPLR